MIAAAGGLLVAAAPAHADWAPSVADLQTVNAMESAHDVAVDDAGNGLAAWEADLGTRTAIRVRRYDAAAGVWESPIRELSLATSDNRKPLVAMDRAGNAFALWQRVAGDGYVLQARRYDRAAGGWESASATLSVGAERVVYHTLAFEDDGDALAAWTGDGVVRVRRYDAAAGAWESTSTPLSSDAGDAIEPNVAIDAKGTATVAWQADGTIEAKRYDALEERWPATPTRLSPAGESASWVRLGTDAAGRVQAVWSASEPGGSFIESRRFDGVWGPPTPLTPKTGIAYSPQLATTPGGTATVVWFALSDGKYVVRARRWDGTRWDVGATLSGTSTHAWSPQLATDAAGRAIVVWRRPGAPSTIESRRFDGTTWEAGPLALSGTTNAEDPDLAVGPTGHAIALWLRPSNGTVTLQARRYVAPPSAGPVEDTPGEEPTTPGGAEVPGGSDAPGGAGESGGAGAPTTPPVISGGVDEPKTAPVVTGGGSGAPAGAPSAPVGGGAPSLAPVQPRASVPDAPEITRLRVGSRIDLRLSAPARLRVSFERRTAAGWRVAPGTLELPAVQRGAVRIAYGKLALAAGRYRVTVRATDARGQRSVPARTTFRVR
ncbi:hypothetical protein C8N24_4206 [Solirubrobacter pauli]|uniref:YD repeat-containing protein n=2 Tax=Solirubrobacter pauli TaxID=166793 RepID=A0A660KX10_9ACTN|nr:hypothetical protein C8N24_4206 [Solirubrobacter pauli]